MLRRQIRRTDVSTLAIVLRLSDFSLILICGFLAYLWRFSQLYVDWFYLCAFILAGLLTFIVCPFFDLYVLDKNMRVRQHASQLVSALFVVFSLLSLIGLFTQMDIHYSRLLLIYWFTLSALSLMLSHFVLLYGLYRLHKSGWNVRRVAIIGDGKLAHYLIEQLRQQTWLAYEPVVVLSYMPSHNTMSAGLPVVSMPENLSEYITSNEIKEIWLAADNGNSPEISSLLRRIHHQVVTIRLMVNVLESDLLHHQVRDIAGVPAITVTAQALETLDRFSKAWLDRCCATLALVVLSPLFLSLAVAIKLTSKGPVLFKQERHGSDGNIFFIYKFRTMYQYCDSSRQASRDDVRVTPIGKFLRRSSLDELPQLMNVIQGTMSIVGPRPHATEHNEHYLNLIDTYMCRHVMKPGITGWAQVNGFRGETETVDKMRQRIEYDLHYIDNWSIFFDLKIILLTIVHLFKRDNAY